MERTLIVTVVEYSVCMTRYSIVKEDESVVIEGPYFEEVYHLLDAMCEMLPYDNIIVV